MEIIIPTLIVLIFLGRLFTKLNEPKETAYEPSREKTNPEPRRDSDGSTCEMPHRDEEVHRNAMVDTPNTCALMFNTLTDLGCQPQLNNDGSISVQYQGENFHMEFDGLFSRVWDPAWAGVNVNDPDISNIREAVNIANFSFGPTVVLTAPNDEGIISFHSRRDIMLHPDCPDNAPFVRGVLNSFFHIKEAVRAQYQQLNAQQQQQKKNRRPVGFTTASAASSNSTPSPNSPSTSNE